MRVFVASGIFHPESGGPATYLHKFLPELLARGHSVTVLTFGDSDHQHNYPYPVTRITRASYPIRQWSYLKAARRLWPGHDLAYVHSIGLPLDSDIRPRVGKIVGDTAWERAIRKGWIPLDTDIDTFQTTRYSPLVELMKMLQHREARQFDSIIVPSQHRKNLVVGWGVHPSRVHVIFNAFDRVVDAPLETQAEARRRLGLTDAPLLIAVSRLIPLKGLQYILPAIAQLDEFQLLIAGDGPMQSILEKQADTLGISRRVRFLGRVDHHKLPLYYRAADYSIVYSGGEGLSHVLLESLGLGTPVIASDLGGNPEIVQHGVNGLLVPYANVEALTLTIRDAFLPGLREDLASHSEKSIKRFRWDTLVQSTIEALQKVCSGQYELSSGS